MTNEKNEVAAWQPPAFEGTDLLPVALVTQQVDAVGRDNIEAEDLILPTLKLLQGSSEEVKQGVEGARAGIFWLSGAEEGFEGPLRVLAVAHTKSRSLFPQDDRPEHEGLDECRSKDAKHGDRYGLCAECPHKEWGEDGTRPACSDSQNFTVLTPYGPALIRFQSRSLKGAKKLLTAWSMSSGPLWNHPLVIITKTKTDKVKGRDSTSYYMDTKWMQRETVPPHAQIAALAVHEQVMAAHGQGRLGTTDESREDA